MTQRALALEPAQTSGFASLYVRHERGPDGEHTVDAPASPDAPQVAAAAVLIHGVHHYLRNDPPLGPTNWCGWLHYALPPHIADLLLLELFHQRHYATARRAAAPRDCLKYAKRSTGGCDCKTLP